MRLVYGIAQKSGIACTQIDKNSHFIFIRTCNKKPKKYILHTIVLNIENLIDSSLQARKGHRFDILGHLCLFDKNIDRLTPYNISHSGKRKFPL